MASCLFDLISFSPNWVYFLRKAIHPFWCEHFNLFIGLFSIILFNYSCNIFCSSINIQELYHCKHLVLYEALRSFNNGVLMRIKLCVILIPIPFFSAFSHILHSNIAFPCQNQCIRPGHAINFFKSIHNAWWDRLCKSFLKGTNLTIIWEKTSIIRLRYTKLLSLRLIYVMPITQSLFRLSRT